jgi:hypothetical protein
MNVSVFVFSRLPPAGSAFSRTGLQLTSHMEEHPYAFVGMTVASSFVAFLVAWGGLRRSVFDSTRSILLCLMDITPF